MLVGEGPGPQEDRSRIPFDPDAPTGSLITAILRELGVSRKQIYITNATRCCKGFGYDTPNQEITAAHIKACKPYLLDEIAKIDPKYIVLAGNEALKACFGHAGITKVHGLLQQGPDGRMYMPILHPASALPDRFPENRERIKSALRNLIGLINTENSDPLYGISCNVIYTYDDFLVLKTALEKLEKREPDALVCIDLETNMLDNAFQNSANKIGGIAFSWEENVGWYLPVHHENPDVWADEQRQDVLDFVRWFSRTKFRKVNQNIKFDYNQWRGAFHVRLRNVSGDCMLASQLYDQNTTHGLDKIAWLVKMGGYDQALERWFASNNVKERNYIQVPLETLGRYGCGDAVCALRAEKYFRAKLEKRHQLKVYTDHVIPGLVPYADMEARGLLVDVPYIDALEKYYRTKTIEYRMALRELAGRSRMEEISIEMHKGKKALPDFNFDSNEQVGRLLQKWLNVQHKLERIKARQDRQRESRGNRRWADWEEKNADLKAAELNPLKTIEVTKSGRLSVKKSTLDSILGNKRDFALKEDQEKFIRTLLTYKAVQKRQSTSVVGMRKHLCPDNRVRATYMLHGAATGRRSCTHPNLQNIPRDRIVKRMFIAPPKHLLLMFDYKNLEVRIAAAMSGDERLLGAFNSGKDVHTYTASVVYKQSYDDMVKILGTPYDAVEKDPKLNERYIKYTTYRAQAKLVMWTILFGGGPEKISTLTGVTMGEAERTHETMLEEFDSLRNMFSDFEELAEDNGYAKTDFGRRRYLLGLSSSNRRVRSDALREALNSPIQGTAAGIAYEALTKVHKALIKARLRAWPVQEVHDAVTVEVYYKDAYEAASLSLGEMESVVTPKSRGKIVFEADASIGMHLGSKTKLDGAMFQQLKEDPWKVYKLCCKDMSPDPANYEPKKDVPELEAEDFDDSM